MRDMSFVRTLQIVLFFVLISLGYTYYYLKDIYITYQNEKTQTIKLKRDLHYLEIENQLLSKEIDLKNQRLDGLKKLFYSSDDVKQTLTKAFKIIENHYGFHYILQSVKQSDIDSFTLLIKIELQNKKDLGVALEILSYLGEMEQSKNNPSLVKIEHKLGMKK